MLVKKIIAGPTRVEIDYGFFEPLLQKLTGQQVEAISRASESYTNEVYKIRMLSGAACYLKFFDDEFHPSRAKAELHAMEEAKKTGIPVPSVIYTDFSRTIVKRDFAIFAEVPGTDLCSRKISAPIVESCLETLIRLHSLKNREYGFLYLPEDQWVKGNRYFDFLEDVIIYGIKKIAKQDLPTHGLYEAFDSFRGKIKEDDYCLNHNDFTTKHVFADNNGITGLIDWEWNAFLNPLNDYVIFINSLLDQGTPKSIIRPMTAHLSKQFDNYQDIDFYAGSRFLLGAIFPHRNGIATGFRRRKLLFGKLLLQKEITFDDFMRNIYETNTFAR